MDSTAIDADEAKLSAQFARFCDAEAQLRPAIVEGIKRLLKYIYGLWHADPAPAVRASTKVPLRNLLFAHVWSSNPTPDDIGEVHCTIQTAGVFTETRRLGDLDLPELWALYSALCEYRVCFEALSAHRRKLEQQSAG